jgi:hypothetical protein
VTPRVKLGAYGLLLAAMVGGGAAVGAAAGPIDVGGSPAHTTTEPAHDTTDEDTTMTSDLPAGGLLVAQDGYSFEPEDRIADPGRFAFTITGPDGHPVESYDLLHDRELHLIVASRDLQHYAHLHPERDARGQWSVALPELPAGAYRAFADFQPTGGRQYTLGVDLTVPGATAAPVPLRPRSTDTVDGFEVTLDGDLTGDSTEVSVTVRRGGDVVTTEPYLGAAGHLVALRDGDLAYLHVHPLDHEPSGPVRFAVEVPSAGTYALFFDFQLDGEVRTARFVIDAAAPPADAATHGGHSDH